MKHLKITALLMFCSVLFCACNKDASIALRINEQEIKKTEFYSEFKKIKEINLKGAPKEIKRDDSYATLMLKERFLNDVIVRELLKQEFEKRKIEVTDKDVQDKKAIIIKRMGSEERLKNVLKENNVSDETFMSDLKNEVKMDKLVHQLGAKEASDSEAQKYYNANKARFTHPELVEASHILIAINPALIKQEITDADKDAKLSQSEIEAKVKEEIKRKEDLAKEIRQKALNNPKSFADLAREFSQDKGSAVFGGQLGFVSKTQVVKEFGNMAFSQKVGTISPIVRTQYGDHIILVTDKKAAGTQSFSEVKEDLKAYLTDEKRKEKLNELIDTLKKTAKIEYVDESLNPDTIRKQVQEKLPMPSMPQALSEKQAEK